MVQEFHVVRCFACQSFQVQQVKKANKWTCKMCGEKQSLLKEFGRGSGADCRRHVQKLNAMRGAAMEEQDARSLWEQSETGSEEQRDDTASATQVSRWSKYLDTPEQDEQHAEEEEEEENENVWMDECRLQATSRTDRKRRRTDGGDDPWIPQQSQMMKPKRVSVAGQQNSRTNSLQQTSPTTPKSTRTAGPQPTGPPTAKTTRSAGPQPTGPPTAKSTRPAGPQPARPSSQNSGSKWSVFLSVDCQAEEEEETSASGRSQTLPPSRPRPPFPASSMFESGEDFSFDDMLDFGGSL